MAPMPAAIHPSAVITGPTEFGPGVQIGPGCTVTGPVTLEENVRLIAGVHLQGPLTIGARTVVYPGACIGFEPQDLKFDPAAPTPGVRIGADCTLREHVTIHAASNGKEHPTSTGDRCFLMVNAHIGHDAVIGSDVVMVNNSAIGGHAQLGDRATLGGNAVLHQFNRVGRLGFVSGGSAFATDIPPFCIGHSRNLIAGLNVVGLRRSGMARDHITLVRQAFREAIRTRLPKAQTIALLRELGRDCPPVLELAEFYATTKRTVAPFGTQSRGGSPDED
ncbi:acyl-ACP--UDP-N-acetylglucosamine O-acyltransferase [soil metagenome]